MLKFTHFDNLANLRKRLFILVPDTAMLVLNIVYIDIHGLPCWLDFLKPFPAVINHCNCKGEKELNLFHISASFSFVKGNFYVLQKYIYFECTAYTKLFIVFTIITIDGFV